MLAGSAAPRELRRHLSTGAAFDPLGDPERVVRSLTRVRDAGATIASTSISASSAEHFAEQLEELHRIALAEGIEFHRLIHFRYVRNADDRRHRTEQLTCPG